MAVSLEDYTEKLVNEFAEQDKQPAWEFAIEIEDAPKELNILAKDLSYEPITINVEEKNYGAQQVTTPIGQERVTLTVTLRDTKKKVLYNWCKKLAAEITHSDGTFGIPAEYVKEVTIFSSTNIEEDGDPDVYYMIFTNVGEISKDRSSREYMEFPITMTQYKTSGFEKIDNGFSTAIMNAAQNLK